MGSARRPGKTLAQIAGKTLLVRCLERLSAALVVGRNRLPQYKWQLVVATSRLAADDPIAAATLPFGVGCVRGSENDVLSRYISAAADLRSDDTIVRATADNPLYCPRRLAELVDAHLSGGGCYTGISEALSPLVPEAMQVGALRAVQLAADVSNYDREHVTPYLRKERGPHRVVWLPPTWRGLRPELRLTVDTPDDLRAMNELYEALIALTGEDRPAAWTRTQIYETALGLQTVRSSTDRQSAVPARCAANAIG